MRCSAPVALLPSRLIAQNVRFFGASRLTPCLLLRSRGAPGGMTPLEGVKTLT